MSPPVAVSDTDESAPPTMRAPACMVIERASIETTSTLTTAFDANTRSTLPKSSAAPESIVFAPVTVHGLPVHRSAGTVAAAGWAASRATVTTAASDNIDFTGTPPGYVRSRRYRPAEATHPPETSPEERSGRWKEGVRTVHGWNQLW